MPGERYLYDFKSQKAVLYQRGEYLYPLYGGSAEHWVSGDYAFCLTTQRITYWILGKDVYGHLGNGELTREPVFCYGD